MAEVIIPDQKQDQPQSSMAQELESWKTPAARDVADAPKPGDAAPQHPNLQLPKDKPTIIVFLRHCGCPCKSGRIALTLTHSHSSH